MLINPPLQPVKRGAMFALMFCIAIAVVTRKGEVQLSGFVDNQTQIDQALVLARGVEGVQSVANEMSIKK